MENKIKIVEILEYKCLNPIKKTKERKKKKYFRNTIKPETIWNWIQYDENKSKQ